jgi:hypothetical protein
MTSEEKDTSEDGEDEEEAVAYGTHEARRRGEDLQVDVRMTWMEVSVSVSRRVDTSTRSRGGTDERKQE